MIYLNDSRVSFVQRTNQTEKQMIQITRQKAEHIFQNFNVVRTEVKKDSSGLKIKIHLSNKKQLQISYHSGKMIKWYFIENYH